MTFFEQQDQARRQTRWLMVLFILAVIAIVLAIDLAVLIGLGMGRVQEGSAPLSLEGLAANIELLAGASLLTLAIIGCASLFKIASLKSGGGKVARSLGATLVDPESGDALHRRLRNVVEEIALASGVPVPEVYVLEQEAGINAFAAGFTTADAAVAVTRGALEKLDRNELQGVIAHEFSHILNGDMRINIRLMGALFGILVLAIIGRRVLFHSRHVGRSKDKGGAAIVLIAVALTAVGYIGLFFGRWIKSAVSRQREYLADASAVQFTREPGSIAGALKKIAIYSEASYLLVDSEEVGHMLFGAGQKMHLFATHPPLVQRIKRIEPGFEPEQLDQMARRLRRDAERRASAATEAAHAQDAVAAGGFEPEGFLREIGNPAWERLLLAAAIAAAVPGPVSRAARSANWAAEALLFLLLDADSELRERQLLVIADRLGGDSEARVRGLYEAASRLSPEQRLPVLEMALPAVKQRPREHQARLLDAVKRVIEVDGRIEVFEYLLARLIRQYLWEAANPRRAARTGRRSLATLRDEAAAVLAILATHGHQDSTAAERAYAAGMASLGGGEMAPMAVPEDWVKTLDGALDSLDALRPEGRQTLVRAMIETVTADQVIATSELELMRAVCAALHVPAPVLGQVAEAGADG